MKGSHIILTKRKEDMTVELNSCSKIKVRWCLADQTKERRQNNIYFFCLSSDFFNQNMHNHHQLTSLCRTGNYAIHLGMDASHQSLKPAHDSSCEPHHSWSFIDVFGFPFLCFWRQKWASLFKLFILKAPSFEEQSFRR